MAAARSHRAGAHNPRGARPQRLEERTVAIDGLFDGRAFVQGVAAAGLREAALERGVGGVEEDDLHLVPLAPSVLERAGNEAEILGVAGVHDQGQLGQLVFPEGGEVDELVEQGDRQVVNHVVPGVLEGAGGRRPTTRAAHARDYAIRIYST